LADRHSCDAACLSIRAWSTRLAWTLRRRHIRETPATLLAWAAKAADTDVEGAVLLRHADAIAQTVTRLQATCVLALDPFDEDTAELWKERYGFKPVAPPLEAGATASDRLWVSLDGLSR
jgi:hypothetical protein